MIRSRSNSIQRRHRDRSRRRCRRTAACSRYRICERTASSWCAADRHHIRRPRSCYACWQAGHRRARCSGGCQGDAGQSRIDTNRLIGSCSNSIQRGHRDRARRRCRRTAACGRNCVGECTARSWCAADRHHIRSPRTGHTCWEAGHRCTCRACRSKGNRSNRRIDTNRLIGSCSNSIQRGHRDRARRRCRRTAACRGNCIGERTARSWCAADGHHVSCPRTCYTCW